MMSESPLPETPKSAVDTATFSSPSSATAAAASLLRDPVAAGDQDHSSSTEGPDSPGASSSGSPVPMMVPVPPYRSSVSYDDDEFERDVPRYRVTFTGDVSKDGDALKHRMLVRSLGSSASASADEAAAPLDMERQWEDFEHLHRQLVSRHAVAGVIVPPLPARPAADARAAEANSRRRMRGAASSGFFSRSNSVASGDGGGGGGAAATSNYVQADDFDRESAMLSAYLDAMLAHPHFGRSQLFADFLEQRDPPPRTKAKKSLFSGMRQSLDFGLKMPTSSTAKDPDDAFAKDQEWSAQYGAQLREAGERFQSVLGVQLRLARQLAHLATALATSVGGATGGGGDPDERCHLVAYNALNSRFSGCLSLERRAVEAAVAVQEGTMGRYLSLWTGYMDAQAAMLSRRACMVSDRDGAARAFSKAVTRSAKGGPAVTVQNQQRVEELRKAKEEKENELERCSKTGRAEIRRFHQRRLTEMRDAMAQYAEGQIECARDACEELAKGLARLKEVNLQPQQQETQVPHPPPPPDLQKSRLPEHLPKLDATGVSTN